MLSEALLVDPYPFEVWLSIRPAGVKGSGTQADAWNGCSVPYPEIAISSLTATAYQSAGVATAVTSIVHGFSNGDMVTVLGVTRRGAIDAFSPDIYYTGTFPIRDVTSNSFKYDIPAVPPSPAQGTIKCWREREQFDSVMRAIGPNTRIHLGAGVFETKGVGPVYGGIPGKNGSWHIKPGQHLLGCGMEITILKLVNACFAESAWSAIGHGGGLDDIPDNCEVADMTIDCNISGQPNQQVTCGAVQIAASHARIRRVHAINFGSQTQTYIENFVVVLNALNSDLGPIEAHDSVIEDCVADRTCPNAVNNSTIFHLGGGDSASGVPGYHRDFAIRNCYVDGRIVYGSQTPVPISSITFSAGVVSVTTKAPHLLTYPGNVIVSGVTVSSGDANNPFNGVFEVDQIISATEFKYSLSTTDTPLSQSGFVGGGVSSHRTNIHAIEKVDPGNPTDFRYRIITEEPHFRTPNNNVRVFGLERPDPAHPGKRLNTNFNGTFDVTSYDPSKPHELIYTLPALGDEQPANLYYPSGFVNIGHQGLSAGGGIGTIVEGNRVYHCSIGGPYHDTYATGDCTTRRNFYHDVLSGPSEAVGSATSRNFNPVPCSITSNNGIATATTTFPHGFRINDSVIISNVYPAAETVLITGVTATAFTFDEPATPVSPPTSNRGYGTYEEIPILGGTLVISFQARLHSFAVVRRNSRTFGRATVKVAGYLSRHGLLLGDAVRIIRAGAFENGTFPTSSAYNGIFRVTAIPDDETFEYEFIDENGVPYDPGDPGSDFSTGYFGRIWQVKRWVVEDNVIELAARSFSGWGNLTGIAIYTGRNFHPEYTVRQAIIRRNVIREVHDAFAPGNFAMDIGGCERLLIERNVISSSSFNPIRHNSTDGSFKTVGNISPDGKLIFSRSADSPGDKAPEVITDVEEATVLSLLTRNVARL